MGELPGRLQRRPGAADYPTRRRLCRNAHSEPGYRGRKWPIRPGYEAGPARPGPAVGRPGAPGPPRANPDLHGGPNRAGAADVGQKCLLSVHFLPTWSTRPRFVPFCRSRRPRVGRIPVNQTGGGGRSVRRAQRTRAAPPTAIDPDPQVLNIKSQKMDKSTTAAPLNLACQQSTMQREVGAAAGNHRRQLLYMPRCSARRACPVGRRSTYGLQDPVIQERSVYQTGLSFFFGQARIGTRGTKL